MRCERLLLRWWTIRFIPLSSGRVGEMMIAAHPRQGKKIRGRDRPCHHRRIIVQNRATSPVPLVSSEVEARTGKGVGSRPLPDMEIPGEIGGERWGERGDEAGGIRV